MTSPSIYFSQRHHDFRRELRAFLQREVCPYLPDWERERIVPRTAWKKLGDAGYLGLLSAGRRENADIDFFHSVVLLEELARTGFTGFRVAVAIQAYMATSYLTQAPSGTFLHSTLQHAIAGEQVAALAITEPGAGSDLAALETQAIPSGTGWQISGEKVMIVNATIADFFVVATRVASGRPATRRGVAGLALFVVPAASPGVVVEPLATLGWQGAAIGNLSLHQVQVEEGQIIGTPAHGFMSLMRGMQLERIVAGFLAVGGADACLADTWSYLQKREVSQVALSQKQVIRHELAGSLAELEAVRGLGYHAAWMYAQGHSAVLEASMFKLRATLFASKLAQQCLHFQGGHGYRDTSDISRMARDAQGATLAAGGSEVLCDVIAQSAFDERNWHHLRDSAQRHL